MAFQDPGFAAGNIDRRPARQEPVRPIEAPRPFWSAVERRAAEPALTERRAAAETALQGALNDRHRQIEALLGRPVPRSAMISGLASDEAAGLMSDADYEARIEALRREHPEQLGAIETRAELNARLGGNRIVTYYDTPRGPAQARTLRDGSLWLETNDGYSGPLSRFPGARPVRRAEASDVSRGDGSTATPRVRSVGERFTSTVEDAAQRNPLMALGRLAVGGGYDVFEDPETGETFEYARFGQGVRDFERERRDTYELMASADAWDAGDASFLHKALRGVATLGGVLTGSMADPLNAMSPGRTVAGRIIGGVTVNAAGDAVTQGADIGAGIQDEYDPLQTVAAGAIGGVIQGGVEGLGAGARRLSGNPGGVVEALASEIDSGSRAATAPITPAARAALARIDRDRMDAARIGPVDGATHDVTQRALDQLRTPVRPNPQVERDIDELIASMPPSGPMSPNAEAALQSTGPAAGPSADVAGTAAAGRVAVDAEGRAAFDPADLDHIDQNHADLWRLGETADPELAEALSRRMSRYMDWTDVQLSRRDRAAVAAGEPVSSRAMIVAARNYRETGGGGSFYDPDALAEVMAANRATERPAAASAEVLNYQGRPIVAGTFDPMGVDADPATFQYKASGDEGLTDRLAGVTSWDRTAAGRAILFEDRAGRVVVADGHQRRGLARRLIETGQDTTAMLDGFLFRQADGWEPRDVRVVAAMKNIREGSGSIVDAAKVFREAPGLINDRSLPLTGEFIANARGLARLSDDAFGAVANGVIPARYGAVIGEMASDRPELHASMVALVREAEPRSIDEARALVQESRLADFAEASGLQADMFGGPPAQSTLIARARLRVAVLKQLRTDARLFGSLIRNADAIEAGGNALARTENEARLARDLAAFAAVDRLSLRVGQVGDSFGETAAAITRGNLTIAAGARAIIDELRQAADLAEAIDAERAVALTPTRPSDASVQALDPFDAPGGQGQVRQIPPKPEDAKTESEAASLWDDLPEVGDEQRALDVLRVCAPGVG